MSTVDVDADLVECYELQLAEVEMLSSMFPDSSEFRVVLPQAIEDMRSFVSGTDTVLPSELDFIFNLDIPDTEASLEMQVSLPRRYPIAAGPVVSVRGPRLPRGPQKSLNEALARFLAESGGEPRVFQAATWVREHAAPFLLLEEAPVGAAPRAAPERGPPTRLWIYSHHIYDRGKRRRIVEEARALQLGGFSLPGKPGLVCAEGPRAPCDAFLQRLKGMSWKRLQLVRRETGDRRFPDFAEIAFEVRGGPAREYHMDMGQFYAYLEEHGCAHVFQDLFGLEGRPPASK